MITDPLHVSMSEQDISLMAEQVDGLLKLLTERERFVISKRFAIDNSDRHTLEDIGSHFDVTRERVRQIERNALQKLRRNIHNFSLSDIGDIANEILISKGGVMKEDDLASAVFERKEVIDVSIILFVLSLDKRIVRHTNTIKFHPYFHLESVSHDMILKIIGATEQMLKERDSVMSIEEIWGELQKLDLTDKGLTPLCLKSVFGVYKHFKVLDGNLGLASWRHINPKTLRDKILCILRKNKKPTHFVDIANSIADSGFDKKKVNLQAVHNELIRHDSFVLIGRGIYALREWGYTEGTVSDIIEALLKQKGDMSEEDIVNAVLEQREVKKITILLNLKNKTQFIRVGRKRYALKKA